MVKIVITGAGSAQSNGVVNCLLKDDGGEEIIGIGSDLHDLAMCRAHRKFLVPHSRCPDYRETLLSFLREEKPDMIHFQHDQELDVALKFRTEIEATGVKLFVPDDVTIDTCVHKYKSWLAFRKAGIKVPENIIIGDRDDLKRAFATLRGRDGSIWLRSMAVGGGGKGALPTNDYDTACEWIERWHGWGNFLAAERLTDRSVTWLSIWYRGELVVAQTRKRNEWAHRSLTPSGVTGITKVSETCSSPDIDRVAIAAVSAVSTMPHGVYGVDMTYDWDGIPNPTELNIGRFFTTIQFFAEAGINLPVILKDLCLYDKFPTLAKRINPLPDGLLWLRAMDCPPRLVTREDLAKEITVVRRTS